MSERNSCPELPDCKVEAVEGLPGVYVRELSGRDATKFEAKAKELEDADNELRFGIIASVFLSCENGERKYTDEDAEMLAGKAVRGLKLVCETALSLNGFSDDAVEDHAKN